MKNRFDTRLKTLTVAATLCWQLFFALHSTANLQAQQGSVEGVWAYRIPSQRGGTLDAVMHCYPNGKYLFSVALASGLDMTRGKWSVSGSTLSLKRPFGGKPDQYKISFSDSKTVSLTQTSQTGYIRTGKTIEGFRFSRNTNATTKEAILWLREPRSAPNVVDSKHVANHNPQGLPPNSNGWVFDSRINGYHPLPEKGIESFYGWLLGETVKILAGQALMDNWITILDGGGTSLPGAFMKTGMDKSWNVHLDVLYEVAFPDSPPETRRLLRNSVVSIAKGDKQFNSVPERTLKSEFISSMKKKSVEDGNNAYWSVFLYDVFKKLAK